MSKEQEVLDISLLLKFLDDWLNRYDVDNIDYNFYKIKEALERLEAIDNANPSEAMRCILDIKNNYKFYVHNKKNIDYQCDVIEQVLLKAQEPKHYLKWEDLEFGVPESLPPTIKVKMGDTQYCLCLRISFSDVKSVVLRDNNLTPILHLVEKEKQIFNDLHLEVVE